VISYLEGKILKKSEKSVILLVGGVGYKVVLINEHINNINTGDDLGVFTHLNVKEDSLDLYGFKSQAELELFELLITISGVGPKAALGIISLDAPDAIAGAILREDFKYLNSVSGIGSKTAQKIVLELKDKIAKLNFDVQSDARGASDSEVIDALEALGYSPRDAREALRSISKEIDTVEDKIREALRLLGKK